MISAKVVGKGSKNAGKGFYNLMEELGIDTLGQPEKKLFSDELKKIRECADWYILADYLKLDLDFSPLYEKLGYTSPLPKSSTIPIKAVGPTSWILPSNDSSYDLVLAFSEKRRFTGATALI